MAEQLVMPEGLGEQVQLSGRLEEVGTIIARRGLLASWGNAVALFGCPGVARWAEDGGTHWGRRSHLLRVLTQGLSFSPG